MSVFCVLVALLPALAIGGTGTSFIERDRERLIGNSNHDEKSIL